MSPNDLEPPLNGKSRALEPIADLGVRVAFHAQRNNLLQRWIAEASEQELASFDKLGSKFRSRLTRDDDLYECMRDILAGRREDGIAQIPVCVPALLVIVPQSMRHLPCRDHNRQVPPAREASRNAEGWSNLFERHQIGENVVQLLDAHQLCEVLRHE